jgi:hypothetical protein
MVRVERMENIRMATRMNREYSSAFSLTVWIRVCGGEGRESMLLCSHRVLFIYCGYFVSILMISVLAQL